MAISNTSLLLSNPDFYNIRSSLKNFLKGQDRFKDFDFEGSNFAVVLDVLAYNTYQNAFLNNMIASEMFLDSAQMRSSVISHAKELGYVPRSMRSSISTVTIEIIPDDDPGTIIVPKHSLFSTSIGNQSFTFMTNQAHTITVDNDRYVLEGVNLYEGFLIEESFVVDSSQEKQKFILSNKNIDTTSIEVFVSNGGEEEQLTFATSMSGVDSSSRIFFIQQDYSERYELVFGDGVLGAELPHDTLIRVTYRITSGEAANGAYVFKPVASISGYTNIIVTTEAVASGGAAEEDIESIRRYAPLLHQTRGRAFTDDDYMVVLQQAYPEIQAINVYGGEKTSPPQYGKVVISIDIAGADGIPDIKKDQYYKALKRVNPTVIEPVFIDPQFLYLKVVCTPYYDYTQTNATNKDIEAAVTAAIMSYNGTYLNKFNTTFRKSKFTSAIDDAHTAINSNDTDVYLSYLINIDSLAITAQTIRFGNQLDPEASGWTVNSAPFKYNNKVCYLRAGGDDTDLYITVMNDDGTSTNIERIGRVDYAAGTVTIYPVSVQAVNGTGLKLYVKTKNRDIVASLNNIIAIDFDDLQVTAVAQRR